MSAGMVIPSIFKAIDRYSKPVDRMSRKTNKLALNQNKMKRSALKAANAIGTFAIAAGATMILGNAITVMRDFEQANADLAAVMGGETNEAMNSLEQDAIRIGGATTKSATQVVKLQEALARLGFKTPQILNMTESVVQGSDAMNSGLAETAELVGAVTKTFDSFDKMGGDTAKIVDKMSLSTQISALNFEKLQTALPNVGGAANAAGVSFDQLLALLGALSDAGIDASSSSTALKNIFITSEKQGLSYSQILEKISKNSHKLTAAADQFGKIPAVSATVLANKLQNISDIQGKLENQFAGTAATAQAKRINTLGGSVELLKSAWESLLIQTDKNTGATKTLAKIIQWIAKNIDWLIPLVAALIATFIVLKGVLLVFNIIAAANPIGLIAIAIVALIVVVTIAIYKFKEWGNALLMSMGPLGQIISAIIILKKHISTIKTAFSKDGFIGGLKAIGNAILDYILSPIQQVLNFISKIPGIGKYAKQGVIKIQGWKDDLGITAVDTAAEKPTAEVVDNSETKQTLLQQAVANVQGSADLNIFNAPAGSTVTNAQNMNINLLTSTQTGGQ